MKQITITLCLILTFNHIFLSSNANTIYTTNAIVNTQGSAVKDSLTVIPANINLYKKLTQWQKIKYKVIKHKLIKYLKKQQHSNIENEDSKIDPLAILSLVFTGLILPTLILFAPLSFIFTLLAIIFGIISLKRIRKSKGKLRGETIAIVGLVLSGTFFLILLAVLAIALASIR